MYSSLSGMPVKRRHSEIASVKSKRRKLEGNGGERGLRETLGRIVQDFHPKAQLGQVEIRAFVADIATELAVVASSDDLHDLLVHAAHILKVFCGVQQQGHNSALLCCIIAHVPGTQAKEGRVARGAKNANHAGT